MTMTWVLALYAAGMVLMWSLLELMDAKNTEKHSWVEKTFLCFVWPMFSMIYLFMDTIGKHKK